MLNFIDTHAHLNFEDYKESLDEVIQRSLSTGVAKIICVSSNIADSKRAIEVAAKYPEIVFPAVGIHPQATDPENKDSIKSQLEQLEDLIKANKVVVIGECGLDYTPSPLPSPVKGEGVAPPLMGGVGGGEIEWPRPIEEQKELFLGQIELSIKYDLPILIHCNKAYQDLCEILKNTERSDLSREIRSLNKLRGVFHFYSGGKKRLKNFLEFNNFLFGVAGTVTYDEGIAQVIKDIPLERLVLETDCPFLAPAPHRGEQNEPGYIPLIAQKVAEIKNTTLEEVAQVTSENAEKLFKI